MGFTDCSKNLHLSNKKRIKITVQRGHTKYISLEFSSSLKRSYYANDRDVITRLKKSL
jgi:hypothetical protein